MKLQFDSLRLQLSPKQQSSQNDMNCVYKASKLSFAFGNLFLGNIYAANDKDLLRQNKIGAVLSVIDTSNINIDASIKRLWFVVEDENEFPINQYFDQSVQFIQQQLQTTNVLVHCYAGISRSASIVLAYLIKDQKMTLDQAITYVKQNRPQIDPNQGFMIQLQEYYEKQQQGEKKIIKKSFLSNQDLTQFGTSSEKKLFEEKPGIIIKKEYQSEKKILEQPQNQTSYLSKKFNTINTEPDQVLSSFLKNEKQNRERKYLEVKQQLSDLGFSQPSNNFQNNMANRFSSQTIKPRTQIGYTFRF